MTEGNTYPDMPGSKGGGAAALAADAVSEKAKTIREQVHTIVALSKHEGVTASEGVAIIRAKETTVRPRFAELFAAGRLIKSPTMRKNPGGHLEHAYKCPAFCSPDEIAYSKAMAYKKTTVTSLQVENKLLRDELVYARSVLKPMTAHYGSYGAAAKTAVERINETLGE